MFYALPQRKWWWQYVYFKLFRNSSASDTHKDRRLTAIHYHTIHLRNVTICHTKITSQLMRRPCSTVRHFLLKLFDRKLCLSCVALTIDIVVSREVYGKQVRPQRRKTPIFFASFNSRKSKYLEIPNTPLPSMKVSLIGPKFCNGSPGSEEDESLSWIRLRGLWYGVDTLKLHEKSGFSLSRMFLLWFNWMGALSMRI